MNHDISYDIERLRREEFPHSREIAYLNHASISPLPVRTQRKVAWVIDQLGRNPGQFWTEYTVPAQAQFNELIARHVNADSASGITQTTTTSAALNAIAAALPLQPGDNILFCDLEFPSNAYPWMMLGRDGIETRCVPARHGGLTLDALAEAADSRTRVVAASAVQFFSGHRTDLTAIGAYCRAHNMLFVVDAIQSVGHIPIDMQAMNIDVLATGGQKSLLALPGTGFVAIRDALVEQLKPRMVGANATQDFLHWLAYDLTPLPGAARFKMGTENVPGMWSILESIGLLQSLGVDQIDRHTTALSRFACDELSAAGYDVITPRDALGPIVTFRSPYNAAGTEQLKAHLESESVSVAMHLDAAGNAYLRASVHAYSTRSDIDRLLTSLGSYRGPE